MAEQCIVVFDDGQSICSPMGWDSDCDGALCNMSSHVAIFNDRAAARKAIRISQAYARLRRAQGLPVNEDFGEAISCVKVVPCRGAQELRA